MADQAQKDSFLAALAQIGGSAGNGRLRDTLSWDEATYDAVKQALIDDGILLPGRGRGGSVSLTNAEAVAPAAAMAAKVDRQVRAARPNTTAANVGYEAELWRMADALRGSMDAAEYKHVVLGLIFLKYISDAFAEMHAKLEAEQAQGADPEDPDEYRAQSIFWVPPEARWTHLKAQARQSTIGQLVDDAMAGIERDNPALKGVLPKDYARPALDKTRLGQLIDLISNIKVGDAEARAKDVLGRVYEYFLSQFASAEGKKGGEFYTPRCVVKLLVEMLEPYRGRVYDPCCGSSGMFVQSMEFIRAHANGNGNGGRAKADISIYGQESNYTTWRLAKMNLAIRGIDGQIAHGDTFHNDRHPDLRADFILANPPFNISDWGGDRLRGDRRWQYGDPPAGNANFAWVQHIVHHLAPAGVAGFVLSNGSMSSNQSGEGEIRKRLVEEEVVDCMVALPGQLFYSTQIPACLWLLARDRKNHKFRDRRGEVLFIDARKMGFMVDRTHRDLSDEDIAKITGMYHLWRGETDVPAEAVEGRTAYEDIPGFCKAASLEEIRKHGHVLTPGRYVRAEAAEEDDEPFADKMARLVADLRAQQDEGVRLDAAIAANLRELGMAGEWPAVPLGDLVDPLRGISYGIVQPGKPVTGGVPIVRVSNVRNGRIDVDTPLRVSPEIERSYGRTRLRGGELLITIVGTVGETAIVPSDLAGWNVARAIAVLPIKPDVGSYWVRLALGSSDAASMIHSRLNTTVQATLNLGDLAKLPILLPPRFERDAIAHILGTLDDKIELNRRMSATLEAMARALFKSWFVDFDPVRANAESRDPGLPPHLAALFPNRLVETEHGDVPEGWEIAMVGEHVSNFDSKRVPVSGAERAKRKGPYPYHGAAGVMDYVDDYLFDGVYLLLGEDGSVMRENGLAVTQYVWGQFWVNNHAHVLQGRGAVSTEQAYLHFSFEPVAPFVTGAVQPKLSQGRMNSIPFVFAGNEICEAFSNMVGPWFARLRACDDEAKTLAVLRDTLLPKLSSGELRVKDAETFLERVL